MPVDFTNDGLIVIAQGVLIIGLGATFYVLIENVGWQLMFMAFTLFISYSLYFFSQFFIYSNNSKHIAVSMKLILVFGTFMLNFWRDGSNDGNVYGFLATLTYDFVFMA